MARTGSFTNHNAVLFGMKETILKTLVASQLCLSLFAGHAFASDAKAVAEVDQQEISLDDSVNLQIEAIGEGSSDASVSFEAPDFDPINQYESQQFRSSFVNGKLSNSSSKTFTVVLRPKRTGKLKIQNIRVNFDQKNSVRANDLSVNVVSGGTQGSKNIDTPLPQNGSEEKLFFVRAEVNKSKVYKGEQAIVSYYVYRRTRIQIREVLRYPNFSDFVREDLEMPILSGRLEFEAVSVAGVPYERALIARYAITPIKTGQLKIDSLALKIDYVPRNSRLDEFFDDPIFQFFNQVNPRSATRKSDTINIESMPLPSGGSDQFSGGVGKFDIRWEAQDGLPSTNNPYSLFLKITGKGNISEIQEPRIQWPSSLRVYQSKGSSKSLPQGEGEKTFEIVVIPKTAGRIEIPAATLEYFDVGSKDYAKKSTGSLILDVQQGSAAAPTEDDPAENEPLAPTATQENPETNSNSAAANLKPRPMDSSFREAPRSFFGQPWWRWLFWLGLVLVVLTGLLVTLDTLRIRSLKIIQLQQAMVTTNSFKSWLNDPLLQHDLNQASAKLDELMNKWLISKFKIQKSAQTRKEIAKILTEQGLSPEKTESITSVLLSIENIRYSGDANDSDRAKKLIEELKKNVENFVQMFN